MTVFRVLLNKVDYTRQDTETNNSVLSAARLVYLTVLLHRTTKDKLLYYMVGCVAQQQNVGL